MMIIVFSDLYFVVKLWFKYDRYLYVVFLYKLIGYNYMYMYYWYLNKKKRGKLNVYWNVL